MSRRRQRSLSSASSSCSSSGSDDQWAIEEQQSSSSKQQRHRKKNKSRHRERSPSSASSSPSSSGSEDKPTVKQSASSSSKHQRRDEKSERHKKSNKSRTSSKKPREQQPQSGSLDDGSAACKEKSERPKKHKRHSGQEPRYSATGSAGEGPLAEPLCHRSSPELYTAFSQSEHILDVMDQAESYCLSEQIPSSKTAAYSPSARWMAFSPRKQNASPKTAAQSPGHAFKTSSKTKQLITNANPKKPPPTQPTITNTSRRLQDDHSGNDSDVPLQRKKRLSKSGESGRQRSNPVANSTDDSDNAPLEETKCSTETGVQHAKRTKLGAAGEEQPSASADVHRDEVNEESSQRAQRPRRSLPEIGRQSSSCSQGGITCPCCFFEQDKQITYSEDQIVERRNVQLIFHFSFIPT